MEAGTLGTSLADEENKRGPNLHLGVLPGGARPPDFAVQLLCSICEASSMWPFLTLQHQRTRWGLRRGVETDVYGVPTMGQNPLGLGTSPVPPL